MTKLNANNLIAGRFDSINKGAPRNPLGLNLAYKGSSELSELNRSNYADNGDYIGDLYSPGTSNDIISLVNGESVKLSKDESRPLVLSAKAKEIIVKEKIRSMSIGEILFKSNLKPMDDIDRQGWLGASEEAYIGEIDFINDIDGLIIVVSVEDSSLYIEIDYISLDNDDDVIWSIALTSNIGGFIS